MCSTYNVAGYSRCLPMVIFYAMLNISGINAQVIYMGNQNEAMSSRLILKWLSAELMSDKLHRRSQVPRSRALQQTLPKIQPSASARDNARKRCINCWGAAKRRRFTRLLLELWKLSLFRTRRSYLCGMLSKSKILSKRGWKLIIWKCHITWIRYVLTFLNKLKFYP